MSSQRAVRALGAAMIVLGCSARREAAPTTDSAVLLATSGPVAVESHGALAERREAQALLDSARAARTRRDYTGETRLLLSASEFMRTEARDVSGTARFAFERAAGRLDEIAARASKREPHSATLLACAFADVHGAEALRHLSRAKDAVELRDNVRGGEELAMSVDHLERALKELGQRPDRSMEAAIADARSLALEMMKGMAVVPDEELRVTEEIEGAVRCFMGPT